jgi:hypothetical protein
MSKSDKRASQEKMSEKKMSRNPYKLHALGSERSYYGAPRDSDLDRDWCNPHCYRD